MNILGIETSCDETACGIVVDGRRILSSKISSQIEMHQRFGGVVPEIAARAHLESIEPVVNTALQEAGLTIGDIDAVAVTQGPGLIGALLVGISYAKALALSRGVPLIPVNHVHAHIHGAFLGIDTPFSEIFPCLALVASGGHTNLFYMSSPTDFQLILYSVDDACGECFDKVAKILGLAYPGGPKIEKAAREGDAAKIRVPRIADKPDQPHFSYSGLKTYMANLVNPLSDSEKKSQFADICAAFQYSALEQIARKLKKTIANPEFHSVKSIIVAGGVSANQTFRDMLRKEITLPFFFPDLKFCSDNGAMIAALGYFELLKKENAPQTLDWDAYSRYPYDQHLH